MPNKSAQEGRGCWKKESADKGLLLRGHIYHIRFTDQFGTVRTESAGPSKAFARKVLEKRRTEVLEKRYFPEKLRRNVSFEHIIDDALEATRRAHALKYGDRRRFRDYRWGVIKEWFKERAAGSITPEEIELRLHEHCKTGATKNQYRVALSKAFKIALANKKVIENPALAVKLQRLNNGRERYLNQLPPKETEDKFLKQLTDEESRLRAVIRRRFPEREPEFDLALHTGMRFSEQYDLRWEDVDFERKVITIPFAKSGKREHIPLNSSAIAALVKLRARLAADKPVEEELVCSSRTEWGARQWFKQAMAEAGVTKLRWHDLRHTFASRLVMADVNILTVQKLMRHETLAMTLRYSHLAPSHLSEAVEKLASECTKSVQMLNASAQQEPRILQ